MLPHKMNRDRKPLIETAKIGLFGFSNRMARFCRDQGAHPFHFYSLVTKRFEASHHHLHRTASSPVVHPIKGTLSRPFPVAPKTTLSPLLLVCMPLPTKCEVHRRSPILPAQFLRPPPPFTTREHNHIVISLWPAASSSASYRAHVRRAPTSHAALHFSQSMVNPVSHHQRQGTHIHEPDSCHYQYKNKYEIIKYATLANWHWI
jgi:hypothetical protein